MMPETFTILSFMKLGREIFHPIGGLNKISEAMAKVIEEEEGIHMSELYNMSASDIDGPEFSFDALIGKIILIVNTASKLGVNYRVKELL